MITHSKKTKYSKYFKGRIHGKVKKSFLPSYGTFGLKALSSARIKENQIEAARRVINNFLNRKGKLCVKVFPNIPVSSKPVDVRMGGGKGDISFWIARIKQGQLLFELDYVSKKQAQVAFYKANAKLPIKTKFIENTLPI